MKIHKGDQVRVIAGKDKGKEGRVLEVLRKRNRLIVEGINRGTKHSKETQTQKGTKKGGIETIDMPIQISNVMVLDAKGNPTRVAYKVQEVNRNGHLKTERVRMSKVTKSELKEKE